MKVYNKHKTTQASKPRITSFKNHWTDGINRRTFIKGSVAASLLASIAACKPPPIQNQTVKTAESQPSLINQSNDIVTLGDYTFTNKQHLDLQAVYMRIFPDDGDGPSANDLNVLTYLEWAMTDEKNMADGDPEFIVKGLGWLNQYTNDKLGLDFIELDAEQQDEFLTNTVQSDAGRNWMSILIYYLIEALTLDPYYGGNTNGIGWTWLQHQGGFPQPIHGKTYRDFT
ncbi:MAG: gluconate 2-dehydrogenase subunit 3 family protein [Marinicellaceae bacterium]